MKCDIQIHITEWLFRLTSNTETNTKSEALILDLWRGQLGAVSVMYTDMQDFEYKNIFGYT